MTTSLNAVWSRCPMFASNSHYFDRPVLAAVSVT
jgi:hypothetical protein